MTGDDPLALFFDGRDLDRSLLGAAEEAGEGWYDFSGWSVMFGAQATREQRLLVSVHELYHSILNDSTAYGSLLHIAAYLHVNGWQPEKAADHLAALIGPVRTAHESFATYGSLFTLGHGNPAVDLLAPYPGYVGYFRRGEVLLQELEAPFVRQCGLNAVFRLCLQPKGLWRTVENVPQAFDVVLGETSLHPDHRLDVLAHRVDGTVWTWLVAEASECASVMSGWPDLEAHIRGELDYDSVNGPEFDDLEQALLQSFYDGLRRLLEDEGFPSLDYDGHQPLTRAMTEAVEKLVPAEKARRPLVAATTAHREIDFIHEFGDERYQVRTSPLAGRLREAETASSMVCHDIEEPHFFLVARHPRRLFQQFRLSPEHQTAVEAYGNGWLGLRRRATRGDGEKSESPERLEALAASADLPIFSSISLLCLSEPDWQSRWWPFLRRLTRPTVLFDLHPFRTLAHWADQHQRPIDFLLPSVEVEGIHHRVFLCQPVSSGLPVCLAPVSEMGGQSLDYFLTKHAEWSGTARQSPSLAKDDPIALRISLGHLLTEESFFDFGAAGDAASTQ